MHSEYTPIVSDSKGSECTGPWCWINFCGAERFFLICWSSNHSKVNKNGIPLYGRCSKHRLTIKSLKWTAISYSIFHANTQDGWIWGLTVHILFDMESVCQNECFYITDETENRLSTKTFNYVKKKKKRCKRPVLHNVDDAEQKKKQSSLKMTNLQHLHSNSKMCLNAWCSSHFQFPKETEIENL